MKTLKKAFVHENYYTYGGAEKVIESITNVCENWDHFALTDNMDSETRRKVLKGRSVFTSFIQNLPFAKTKFRNYLPFFPFAMESFDLRKYELIVSSSASVAKGILTHRDQLHICYMHTPIRYAWDLQWEYLEDLGLTKGLKGLLVRWVLHYIRHWDMISSHRADVLVANSKNIAKRIKHIYNREAEVVYPPVNTDKFVPGPKQDGDYYITYSRLVPYKRIDLIVQTLSAMGKKLKVIGDGPEMEKIKNVAGPSVELLGFQDDERLLSELQSAKAFIFAANEDFGIAPVEAQACGIPVIAFGIGGSLETVRGFFPGQEFDPTQHTGVYFKQQNQQALAEAIEAFEAHESEFDGSLIRNHALSFNQDRFQAQMSALIEREWEKFQKHSL